MAKVKVVNHLRVIKYLEKQGYKVVRKNKHVILQKENSIIVVPRHNPLKRFTLEGILRDAEVDFEDFNRNA